jgi:hypothetical protein
MTRSLEGIPLNLRGLPQIKPLEHASMGVIHSASWHVHSGGWVNRRHLLERYRNFSHILPPTERSFPHFL